jgi:DNA-binding HxlR family transcriptional regulator
MREGMTRGDDEQQAMPGGAAFCGVAAAVTVLGDAWTLLLVRDLAEGPRRFTELHASTGISDRVLSDRLRTMAANGLVTRRMYAEIPPRVEYALTERGRDALAVVAALRGFGEKWLRPEGDAQ